MSPNMSPSRSTNTLEIIGLIGTGLFPALAFTIWLFDVAHATMPAAGGGNVPNIFAPASGHAQSLFDLSMFVLVVTGVISATVCVLLAWAIIKFRGTSANADSEPPQVYGSNQIETAWTVIPVLVVLVLFLATARGIHAVQDAPMPPGALEVTVI